MTLTAQTNRLIEALTAWVAGKKGFVRLAGDEADLFTVLGAQPGALRVGVMFDSEEAVEDNDTGYTLRRFVIAISRGKGFFLEDGTSLVAGNDETPLFLLAEEVREVVRSLRFDLVEENAPEVIPRYLGTRRVQYAEHVVGAYAVEIGIHSHIPQQT